MIAHAWRRFRVWRDERQARSQVRVVGDEALRLLRLASGVDELLVRQIPPRPRPDAVLQMNPAEVAALVEAVRSDPMWGQLRPEPVRSDNAAAVELHKVWRRIEALRSLRRV